MPLIDVTYDGTVGEEVLHRLVEVLPDAVAEAVDCPPARLADQAKASLGIAGVSHRLPRPRPVS